VGVPGALCEDVRPEDDVVEVLLYALGALLMLAGLAGLLLPAMPGAPLIFAGVLSVAWAGDFQRIGLPGLLIVGTMAVIISAVDYAAGMVGAKRYGASFWGVLGAFLGLIAGLPFALPGIVLGPMIGAIVLEYLKEPDFHRASRVGFGTLLGFVVGTAVKYALAFLLIGMALLAWLFG
jgi:uncharacterized protein YqgC (DUF456 family)